MCTGNVFKYSNIWVMECSTHSFFHTKGQGSYHRLALLWPPPSNLSIYLFIYFPIYLMNTACKYLLQWQGIWLLGWILTLNSLSVSGCVQAWLVVRVKLGVVFYNISEAFGREMTGLLISKGNWPWCACDLCSCRCANQKMIILFSLLLHSFISLSELLAQVEEFSPDNFSIQK